MEDREAHSHGHDHGRQPRTDDDRIHEEVHERLSRGFLDASDVDVEVRGGVITLEGSVESRDARNLIAELLQEIKGARQLINHLGIKPHIDSYDALLHAQRASKHKHHA
jgi:osmotically-inducible protein OsmY